MHLTSEECTLLRYFITIRALIFVIVITASWFDDHNADAFKPPLFESQKVADRAVEFVLGGYRKWDSLYFSFIAQTGYLYEPSLAFFPLFPLILGLLSRALCFLLCFQLSIQSCLLIVGLIMNHILGGLSTVFLYRLGLAVIQSHRLSYLAALLFCLNPATIFFSSLYSESLFFLLTISGLRYYESHRLLPAALLFSLTTACRSNGLLNVGYIAFSLWSRLPSLSRLLGDKSLVVGVRNSSLSQRLSLLQSCLKWWAGVTLLLAPYVLYGLLCTLPFLAFQAYAYAMFCPTRLSQLMHWLQPEPSPNLVDYGLKAGHRLPDWLGESTTVVGHPDWCQAKPPHFSYSHIQRQFWDVGALRYYRLRQIPNFALATPVILLSFSCASAFYSRAPRAYKTLGLFAESERDRRLVPYVCHMLFLSVYGLIHINAQVLTRLVFSSCPIVYWYCAYLLFGLPHWQTPITISSKSKRDRGTSTCVPSAAKSAGSCWKSGLVHLFHVFNPMTRQSLPWRPRLLLAYFVVYAFVGTVLHSKFLPWT